MVRFLHTADWQLGMTRHFLGPDAQPRFSAARVEAIGALGALATAERCGFVVVCGDVFETNHVERAVVVRALDAMAATPGVTFYLLPGNHDPLDAASVFRSLTFVQHQPDNVIVLDGSSPIEVAPGVELVAAPWLTKRPLADLVAEALAHCPADGTIRIAVGHGAVDERSPSTSDPALISTAGLAAAVADGRVHYVALGDRHSTTSVGRTGRVWYSGAPEPTDFRETEPGNALVVEVGTDAVSVEPHRVGRWRFLRHTAHLTGPADIDSLDRFLGSLADKSRTIVRLALIGQLSLAQRARLDDVLAHHEDLLASLDAPERRSELVVLPDGDDLADLELAGFARQAVEDLRLEAAGGAATAGDALALLHRLARGAA